MEYLIQSDKEFKNKNSIKTIEELERNWANSKKKKKTKKKKRRKERKRTVIRSYKTYMQSALWQRRKNRYFQKYGKICEACKDSKYVTLHHAIYRQNYGDEPDSEVFAMCQRCHHAFHEWCPAKKDMRAETKEFLEDMWTITQGMKELKLSTPTLGE